MFGIGFTEIVVIVVAALILVRPEDLPRMLVKAARMYGRLVGRIDAVKRELREMGEVNEGELSPENGEEEWKNDRND